MVELILNFFSKKINFILISFCAFVFLFLFFSNLFLNHQNERLKSEIASLGQKNLICDFNLQKQNEEIKKLENKEILKENEKAKKVEKIFIEDNSTRAELNAYKKIFNASF